MRELDTNVRLMTAERAATLTQPNDPNKPMYNGNYD
jgi:hypothetical protein